MTFFNSDEPLTVLAEGEILHTEYLHDIFVSPLQFLCGSIVIYHYIHNKRFRRTPGDIFIMLAIQDLVSAIYRFMSGLNSQYSFYDTGIKIHKDNYYCQISGIIYVTFSQLEVMYKFCFFIYAILKTNAGLKQSKLLRQWVYHSIPLLYAFGHIIIWNYMGRFGISEITGHCTVMDMDYILFIMLIVSVLFSFFTIHYIVKHIPNLKKFKRQRKFVIDTYIILTGLWTCNYIPQLLEQPCFGEYKGFIKYVYLVFMFLSPASLPVCIILFLKSKTGKKFRRCRNFFRFALQSCCCFKKESGNNELLLSTDSNNHSYQLDQSATNLSSLINYKRITMICTVLDRISGHLQKIKENQSLKFSQLSLPNLQLNRQACSVQFLSSKIEAYNDGLFKVIQEKQIDSLLDSLDHVPNYKCLMKDKRECLASQLHFSFNTFDNKLTLKCIPLEQLQFLNKHIKKFNQHWEENPDSLIIKVFGLFRIDFTDITNNKKLVLLENIAQINQVEKIYNLNGECNFDDDETTIDYTKMINKGDSFGNEFVRLEGSLCISKSARNSLLFQIEEDVKFLTKLRIRDYHLRIVKVDRSNPQVNKLFPPNNLKMPKCQKYNEYYRQYYWHIGIVNYYSSYTFQSHEQAAEYGKKILEFCKFLTGVREKSSLERTIPLERSAFTKTQTLSSNSKRTSVKTYTGRSSAKTVKTEHNSMMQKSIEMNNNFLIQDQFEEIEVEEINSKISKN